MSSLTLARTLGVIHHVEDCLLLVEVRLKTMTIFLKKRPTHFRLCLPSSQPQGAEKQLRKVVVGVEGKDPNKYS